jgi:oxidase EvaA
VPLDEDFCWLTLGQIAQLLHQDNVVNMDSRTVLACLPGYDVEVPAELPAGAGAEERFRQALARSRSPRSGALLSDVELLSWFTAERSRYDVRAERVPLDTVPGWKRTDSEIEQENGRYFSVVAVKVHAGNREVTSWTQPLIEPRSRGVAAFLARPIDGVLHVLAHAKVEGGFLDTVELAPTVQQAPENYQDLPPEQRPAYLDLVLAAGPERIRYEAVHSEEGGRFLNAENRYLVVEVTEDEVPLNPPAGYQWVTIGQLGALIKHGHYVNVQARTLLACLNAMGHSTDA